MTKCPGLSVPQKCLQPSTEVLPVLQYSSQLLRARIISCSALVGAQPFIPLSQNGYDCCQWDSDHAIPPRQMPLTVSFFAFSCQPCPGSEWCLHQHSKTDSREVSDELASSVCLSPYLGGRCLMALRHTSLLFFNLSLFLLPSLHLSPAGDTSTISCPKQHFLLTTTVVSVSKYPLKLHHDLLALCPKK